MSSFWDQYNENLRAYRRAWPQRLLKVAIVIGAVLIVAPCASVIGNQFGPTAAFVVALCGLLGTIVVWIVASMVLSAAAAPPAPLPVPPQPGSPLGPQTVPPVVPPQPALQRAPRSSGGAAVLVILLVTGLLALSCCGGGVALVACWGSARLQPAAPAAPQAIDPFEDNFQRHQEFMRQQERKFRELEQKLNRDPFAK